MLITRHCPKCFADVEHEQFTVDGVTCPGCGANLKAVHGCCYDDETQIEDCYDYLDLETPEL